jgi:exodeoxyribonuclease VII large subunit
MELDRLAEMIPRGAGQHFETFRQRLAALLAVIREHRPDQQIARARERLGFVRDRIRSRVDHGMSDRVHLLRETAAKLRLLGPQATLDRGYTITTDAAGRLLRSRSSVASGTVLRTRFADGETRSVAE